MEKRTSRKTTLTRRQLKQLAPVLIEVISKSTGVKIPTTKLVSYIGQNGIVVLPSQRELENMLKKGAFQLTITVNPEPVL